jgi:hypothetical protein
MIYNACGKPTELEKNLSEACAPVQENISFFCSGCGRPTSEPEEVCVPMRINPSRG